MEVFHKSNLPNHSLAGTLPVWNWDSSRRGNKEADKEHEGKRGESSKVMESGNEVHFSSGFHIVQCFLLSHLVVLKNTALLRQRANFTVDPFIQK